MNPYQVVEGMIIAAHVVGATSAFLALKGSFTEELDNVTRAVQEMQQAGICSDCSVTIVRGPDEYLFGEEKRSEEHTSELQSLMRISYAVFCLQKKKTPKK